MRRHRLGEAPLRIGGYPKDGGRILADGHGNTIGTGRKIGCSRIAPGRPGSWISNERCSYQFKVNGAAYSCRGYGDGMSASCRRMKTMPRGLAGFREGPAVTPPAAPAKPAAAAPAAPAIGRARRRRR